VIIGYQFSSQKISLKTHRLNASRPNKECIERNHMHSAGTYCSQLHNYNSRHIITIVLLL